MQLYSSHQRRRIVDDWRTGEGKPEVNYAYAKCKVILNFRFRFCMKTLFIVWWDWIWSITTFALINDFSFRLKICFLINSEDCFCVCFESAFWLWRLIEENQGSIFWIILGTYLLQIYGHFFEEEVIHFWGLEGLEIYEFTVIVPFTFHSGFLFSFHQMQQRGFSNTYSIRWFRFN